MTKDLKQAALAYHAEPTPGKISVELTKPAETQLDLALAYSPGVAEPCREIAEDHASAYHYTGKGNLVAVISNGTAVLGLGNLGALASKPVMEGKALLFKRFAGINSIAMTMSNCSSFRFACSSMSIVISFLCRFFLLLLSSLSLLLSLSSSFVCGVYGRFGLLALHPPLLLSLVRAKCKR